MDGCNSLWPNPLGGQQNGERVALTFSWNPTARQLADYEQLVRQAYFAAFGFTYNEDLYAGYPCETMVCLDDGQVISGMKVFRCQPEAGIGIPLEKENIDLPAIHQDLYPSQTLYGEVCRVTIRPGSGQPKLFRAMMFEFYDHFKDSDCRVFYWVSPVGQTRNARQTIRSLGALVHYLGAHNVSLGDNSVEMRLHLSCICFDKDILAQNAYSQAG